MATIQEFLAAQGLAPEEVAAIVGNEKQAKAMSAALAKFDEGATALADAQAVKEDTTKYWAEKTTALETGLASKVAAEKRAALAEAERARLAAYLQSLKDQKYDVPDEYIGAPKAAAAAAESPDASKFLTRDDWEKQARGIAPDLVRLNALGNKYQYLTGQPYITGPEDLEEATKVGKPMVEYVEHKYGFAAKMKEKDDAAKEASYQARYKEDLAKEQAKWAETHGSNPDTRAPMPSKFDRLQKQSGVDMKSWANKEGRDANRAARMKRFENIPIQ